MNEEQWKLYKEFCQFAKLQDNSGAEKPNCRTSLQLFLDGSEIDGWDCLDDSSIFTPEFLTYVLLKAKEFWEKGNGKKCVICGRPFVSPCAKRKTCSRVCYYRLWRREHSFQDEKKLLKRCSICGTPCQSLKQTYCSKKCKLEAKHLRRPDLYKSNKYAGEVRVCPVCSATFLAGIHNKKYCSRKCYIKASNQRQLGKRV